jgi:hypothetical protein
LHSQYYLNTELRAAVRHPTHVLTAEKIASPQGRRPEGFPMNRFARTAGRRFGHLSLSIANASRHIVPPNLTAWKVALYLIVFLLPGGSFAVLGIAWFENRQRRKTSERKPAAAKPPRLPSSTACTHGKC